MRIFILWKKKFMRKTIIRENLAIYHETKVDTKITSLVENKRPLCDSVNNDS